MGLIKSITNTAILSATLALAVGLSLCALNRNSFAMGQGGGTNFVTICHETSALDADGKKADSAVDDQLIVEGKLKTRDGEPLIYEIKSTVSNPSSFTGGDAKVPLVINPNPKTWTFDGFLVPVDSYCKRTSDPIMASFNGGTDTRSLDPAVEGNVLNPDALEDVYKAVSAVAGFPTSAWDDDTDALYTAVCEEVENTLGDPAGLLAMQAAGDVGIVAGAQGQTLARCLGNSSLVTYVGAPEGGCTAEEVAAASTDIDANILDIPTMGLGASSAGSGLFELTLTNENDCTVTVTLDISDCSAPVVDDPCSH